MPIKNNEMKNFVEKILNENSFVNVESPILSKGYNSYNAINPEESYSLRFISIINFTNRPYVFFSLGSGERDSYELAYVDNYDIYKVIETLAELVTCVFPLSKMTQRRIIFDLLYFIKDRLLKFDNFVCEKNLEEEDFLIKIKEAKPTALDEIEYIEEVLGISVKPNKLGE